jgi:acyl-CoA dehydrogenase
VPNDSELDAYRKVVAAFVDHEVVPHVMAWDRAERMDRAIVGKLGSIGALGLTVPEAYGGSGGDTAAYVALMEELGRGDSCVRGIVSVSLGLVGKTLLRHGREDQRQEWLPKLCSGAALGCFGLTEPDSGSDPASLRSRAVRDGDHWLLSGNKIFITNGTWADLALVFARTGGAGPKGITAFLVPTSSPGFSATAVTGKLGLRSQSTGNLTLDQVRVPDSARLGDTGGGFTIAMTALDAGRLSVAAGSVGLARGCLESAVAYAQVREQFGRVIAGFQLVQELLADIAVETDAARCLVRHAAELADAGSPDAGLAASKAKLFASEVAVRASGNALQVFGGHAYVDDHPLRGHFADPAADHRSRSDRDQCICLMDSQND